MAITLTPTLTPASGTASAPKVISYGVTASGGVTPYVYHWDFGDGYTSKLASGTHEYLQAGTYAITLNVTDGLGATASWTTVYVVTPALVVQFTAAVTSGVGGTNSVQFTDTSTGGTSPFSRQWDFGDGTTSTATNPNHVYAEAGSYQAKLTITDADAHVGTYAVRVLIANPMTVTVTGTPIAGAEPITVNFTATADGGTGPYTYTWDFDDGTVGSGTPVQHTFRAPGTYEVKVGVIDSLLHDTGGRVVIEVTDPLKSDPDRFPEKGTPPFPVTFYANAVGGQRPYTYEWDFADGTPLSTEQNPIHIFTMPGYYNVRLTLTDANSRTHTTYIAVDAGELPPPPPAGAGVTIYLNDITIYGNNFTIYGQGV